MKKGNRLRVGDSFTDENGVWVVTRLWEWEEFTDYNLHRQSDGQGRSLRINHG